MTDDDFIAALEEGRLPEDAFRHAGHVRAAYLYLRGAGFAGAITRMSSALRRFAAAQGKAGLYHETITVAFLALINQRLHERGHGGGWEGFFRENPDLLDKNVLAHYYRQDTLRSPSAREVFVLGELAPRPCDGEEHARPVPHLGAEV
jgi:hypothetical protein